MAKLRILFFGTPEFSTATLNKLIDGQEFEVCAVVTQPDKPAGRGQKIQSSPVKIIAEAHNIPVLQPAKIRKEEDSFLKELSALGPFDFGVVIAFGQILPVKTLNFPKFGCINIHASLLPRWRGAAPIQRALLAGDKKTGVCIMQMDSGLDTGPVFCQEKIDITEDDNADSVHDNLSALGACLLAESLPKIASGTLSASPQNPEGVTYAEKISNSDLKIDWSASAKYINRQIKTFSPKPAAFSFLDGKRLKITKAKIDNSSDGQPGQIIQLGKDSFTVKCADISLKVLELQIEGKKAMSTEEFLRGCGSVLHKKLG